MSTDNTDQLLVARAVAGDPKAFELLVVKYQRRIERLVSRMVRDHELVQDIAQETFIRAYRALPQFRGVQKIFTWRELEPSEGRYDFSSVRATLDTVVKRATSQPRYAPRRLPANERWLSTPGWSL